MKDQLIHHQNFAIRGYDVGPSMQANVLAIIRILHDSAVDQVIDLGFSALQLAPRDLAWVLVQQNLQIFIRPALGDQVRVVTFPSGVEKAFTYRDYYMYSMDNMLMAQASTTWILMNTQTRKISAFPSDIGKILNEAEQLSHIDRALPFRVRIENPDFEQIFKASFFEMDFNDHISNYYFFKWMLDTLPYDFLYHHTLQDFNVKLKGEAQAGDIIRSRARQTTDLVVEHELFRKEELIALGISKWR